MTSEPETLNSELETRSSAEALTKEKHSPSRILIVDDHAIVRYGMGVMLSGADDLSLCGEAETIDQAIAAIRELKPDAAVIDIVLKEESGLDLIRKIRDQESDSSHSPHPTSHNLPHSHIPHPTSHNSQSPLLPHSTTPTPPLTSDLRPPTSVSRPLPILVMSMHNESTHAEKALRAGAQGYIMKEDADEVLIEALRTVLSGKLFVSDAVSQKMLHATLGEETSGVESLTAREKEVFECLGQGLTTREMADQFNISPRTVEVHRANIKKKLECETAAQLLRMAVQWVENQ